MPEKLFYVSGQTYTSAKVIPHFARPERNTGMAVECSVLLGLLGPTEGMSLMWRPVLGMDYRIGMSGFTGDGRRVSHRN